MSLPPASCLYVGTVAHRRFLPREHRFQYPFFMWFFRLDELAQLPRLGRWFATDGWALSRFHRPDYLGDPALPLADEVRRRMGELTGEAVRGQVCALLNLRTAGLYFSPVNFYYGYDQEGEPSHFLAEVANIPWNERHHYAHLFAREGWQPSRRKEFHVSPFNPIDQQYTWQLSAPAEELAVGLAVDDGRGRIFEAKLRLERQPLNLPTVRRQLLRKPALTAFVVAGIYYQACRLYLKGVPYIPHPKEAA